MPVKYDGNFWVLEIFKNIFEIRMGDLGGIFSEIYSFESFLYDFWILTVFWGSFFGVIFGFLEIFENVVDMRMYDFMGSFSEIYSFEWSLYDMCLACLVFSLTECHTFIVTGWLGESETIVNNIDTRWHHMLVVLCSNKCLPKQIQMSIAYVYGISPYWLAPRG